MVLLKKRNSIETSEIILKKYNEVIQGIDPSFRKILEKIQKKGNQRHPPEWLHWQMLERCNVLEYAQILEGSNILEIGCGPHAMATIPLAALVGENGRVVAVDLGRWGNFCDFLMQSGLSSRVLPLQCVPQTPIRDVFGKLFGH